MPTGYYNSTGLPYKQGFKKGNKYGSLYGKHFGNGQDTKEWAKGHHWKLTEQNKINIGLGKRGKPCLKIRGENHYLWSGGLGTENSKIRSNAESKQWSKSVLRSDDYICQKCNKKGGRLHAHHIQNFSSYLELRFVTDNGITFCEDCHKLFHHIYGIKNNNQEQVNEFINKNNTLHNSRPPCRFVSDKTQRRRQ